MLVVIPVKTGIHFFKTSDSRLRGNDMMHDDGDK